MRVRNGDKNKLLQVRITTDEEQELQARADLVGMTKSDYVTCPPKMTCPPKTVPLVIRVLG